MSIKSFKHQSNGYAIGLGDLKRLIFYIISALLALPSITMAQTSSYDESYFRSPMDIPLLTSGTFGELRKNHFHTGIDFKTGNAEGKNIYAVADGFVSRIKISSRGYGNAVYIDHPNGYTSVYAHLLSFDYRISEYVRAKQYELEKFEIDINPTADQIYYNKGDVIAKSGNSGSSAGPHLHFEIRETDTEFPLNPMLFGFDIEDTQKPTLNGFYVYEILNGKAQNPNKSVKLIYKDGVNTLNGVLKVNTPEVAFAVKTQDRQNGSAHNNGVYKISLNVNNEPYYQFDFDKLSFAENRYLNAHIDYKVKIDDKKTYHRLFKLPGNNLSIYDTRVNDGIVNLSDGQIKNINITISDHHGNRKLLNFQVQYNAPNSSIDLDNCDHPMPYYQDNFYSADGFELKIPSGVLYQDVCFTYEVNDPISKSIRSKVHTVNNKNIGAHSHFQLAINPDKTARRYLEKTVMCYLDYNNKEECLPTVYDGKYFRAENRYFGKHYLKIDTIAPVVSATNFKKGAQLKASPKLKFSIKEKHSGLKSYSALLNGKWAILAYDSSDKEFTFTDFENKVSGKNYLRITTIDKKGNLNNYETHFILP